MVVKTLKKVIKGNSYANCNDYTEQLLDMMVDGIINPQSVVDEISRWLPHDTFEEFAEDFITNFLDN